MTVVVYVHVRPADRTERVGTGNNIDSAGCDAARVTTAQDGEERRILDHPDSPAMTRIDRFARGTGHLKAIVQTKKGTARHLKSDRETGDTTTPGAFAAFILGLRREHQLEDVGKTRPALREVKGAGPLRQEGSR